MKISMMCISWQFSRRRKNPRLEANMALNTPVFKTVFDNKFVFKAMFDNTFGW